MKLQSNHLYLAILLITLLISGCSNKGPIVAPMLELSPKLLIDKSDYGDNVIIKLNVINQISTLSTSAYQVENNLRELFTELLTDSLEKQGFEIILDDEDLEDAETPPIYYNFIINELSNKVQSSSLSTQIISEVALELRASNKNQELIKKFNSRRLNEVALSATVEEMTELSNLAVAQIIRRVIMDEELRKFSSSN